MNVRRVRIMSNGDTVLFNSQEQVINIISHKPKPVIPIEDYVHISHFKKHRKFYTSSALALVTVALSSTGFAAETTEEIGGRNIIMLLQKASFYVGMGVAIWGIVEAMLDFPGWKARITKGILGYIGILLVPLVFISIQDNLAVDVWSHIDRAGRP